MNGKNVKNKRITLAIGCFIGVLLSSGCTTMKVKYPTDDVPLAINTCFSGKTLAIKPFDDVRTPIQMNSAWYKEKRLIQLQGAGWYFNHTDNYKDDVIGPWISQMMAKHLYASHLFSSVSSEDENFSNSDYILQGKIKKFEGYKEQNMAAIAGSQFGLIGALATMGVKSRYEGTTLLVDIALIEKTSGNTIWQGSALGHVKGRDYADAYGWSAYGKANISLKKAVNNLIQELKQVKIEKPPVKL